MLKCLCGDLIISAQQRCLPSNKITYFALALSKWYLRCEGFVVVGKEGFWAVDTKAGSRYKEITHFTAFYRRIYM